MLSHFNSIHKHTLTHTNTPTCRTHTHTHTHTHMSTTQYKNLPAALDSLLAIYKAGKLLTLNLIWPKWDLCWSSCDVIKMRQHLWCICVCVCVWGGGLRRVGVFDVDAA